MASVDRDTAAFLEEWERQGAALRADYERKRDKSIQAQAAAEVSKERLEVWERAKAIWLELHPEARPLQAGTEAWVERFRKMSTRDMLVDLARESHGVLRVADAAERLAAAGLFANERNASKNISTTVGRSPDLFERIQKGRYRLIEPDSHEPEESEPVASYSGLTADSMASVFASKINALPPASQTDVLISSLRRAV